ncbi:disease resistance protein RPV1-like isoform X3 [Diospyros lotus]|uniref:disease resistance protein RPV1-like isoform X3 n=1 Tax=Diospyros lotus TaxID=55363 RepID=UPI002256ECB4|nr:disease resistance protein RPV1-like isoform X3 [Diospyros lotus]
MEEKDGVMESTPAFRLKWDVFLSFRGEDTRYGFTTDLYNSLFSNGIRVFLDNEGMDRGDEIAPSLLEAIEDSAAAIAVISPKYASSRWCLEELARICELRKLVLPVFFEVNPSDVRRLKGPFEKDIEDLERRFGVEKVVRWRNAMERVGGISGWIYKHREAAHVIETLVKRILNAMSNSPVVVAPYTVGLDFPIQELMEMLDVTHNVPQVLGFLGTGGIGKTTLAKAVYNKLARHFECRSFISDVRETFAKPDGVLLLQNKLIKDLSTSSVHPNYNNNDFLAEIRRIFMEKRVMIVLDDVDDAKQLNELAIHREWFFEGSRIIISTKNRDALPTDVVNRIYEVRTLRPDDSLKLFSYYALRREKPSGTFLKLSEQIVSITGGLPLALQVFGSLLFDKRRLEEWSDALEKLKKIRPDHLHDILRISFDALDEEEKCIFLDIACLLINLKMKREDVIDVMKGCGFRAEIALSTLTARSLIKVNENDELRMHDQIRDMGRQIILQESYSDIGQRSRIWDRGDVLEVLQGQKGTRSIQGLLVDLDAMIRTSVMSSKTIALDNLQRVPNFTAALTYMKETYKEYFQHVPEEGEVIVDARWFKSMVNLRMLQFSNVRLEGDFHYIPSAVKWLQWRKCSHRRLPSVLLSRELAVLDLAESKIERVWGWKWFWDRRKVNNKLKVLNLYNCCKITSIPDLSGHKSLEKLTLELCVSLKSIHKSIGDLENLCHLNLKDCSSLVQFPNDVSGLKRLKVLILSGCSQIKNLPQNIGSMNSLQELLVDNTAIEELPETIFRLASLERLSLNSCKFLRRLPMYMRQLRSLRELSLHSSALEELPDSIGELGNLEILNLMRCKSLTVIPDSIGNLKSLASLWLNGSSVEVIPASVGSLYYLKDLSVGDCQSLHTLPVSIEGLSSLIRIQLDRTAITGLPDQFGSLKSLRKLEIRDCKNLDSLPDSIGNMSALHTLILNKAVIIELPESIGKLENLTLLRLNQCTKLSKLPASFGNLKNLHHLFMEETSVTELPETFGMLCYLRTLKMAKKPCPPVPQISETLELATSAERKVLPSSFSNLSLLVEFNARAWKISGKIPDDFEKLSSLEDLNLSHNDFYSLPSSMKGLQLLKKLVLSDCKLLKVLPPLPSSLHELNAANCTSLESLSDLSNLQNLIELEFTNCEKLVDVPGIEQLKSLRRLYMAGCSSHASTVIQKLDKIALRNLYNLGIPGSDIPDWFTRDEVCFSKKKDNAIKSVIIAAVVSINSQIQYDSRYELPVIVEVEAKILRVTRAVFNHALYLRGVPSSQEDQLYLCRYPDCHPLVTILEDGDKIQVTRRNPPFDPGVTLENCGIHLIYENDDDYDGNEESLNKKLHPVTQKLSKFIGSPEEHNIISNFNQEGMLKKLNKTELGFEDFKRFIHYHLFILLFCLFILFCIILYYFLNYLCIIF